MQARCAGNYKVIDVSHHNGKIDWKKVAWDGVKGVYIKATEGRTYTDPKCLINYEGAKAAGLRVGFYHFARPDNNRPADEVNHFIEVTKSLETDLPYCLDLEVAADLGADRLTNFAYEWMTDVRNKTGHPVMIYSSASYARSYLKSKVGQFPLWVAHYTTERAPMANHTWNEWHMFQYTNSGKVNGISGNVDINEAIPGLFELVSKPVSQAAAAVNAQKYRLRTGTFSDRATAERMAAELKQRYGWLVYIEEE
ncbi:GH25 family lysozyme M1 (1,4-beta-N-acetylmuramidase) [Bacillus fengqiuensis]|nr:GH25 family lysozyme M1 (1,4-beta-N-acetylmuramidase) [Bacillus fengqiuensis]